MIVVSQMFHGSEPSTSCLGVVASDREGVGEGLEQWCFSKGQWEGDGHDAENRDATRATRGIEPESLDAWLLGAGSAIGGWGGVNQGRVVVAPREVQGSVLGLGDQDHDPRREGRVGDGHRGGIGEAVPEAREEDTIAVGVSGHERASEDHNLPLADNQPLNSSGDI